MITIPELDSGGVTQARTLDEVPATVAGLVALMTDTDPAGIEVHMKVRAAPGPDPGRIARFALAAVGATAALARRVLGSAARVPAR